MAYEVTIGIPVYNVERYIRLAMDSALAQTFRSIEFLVIDDCGTDGSMGIVGEYQATHSRGRDIRVVRQPRNSGVSAARNRMIEESRGRFLYFMDSDDTIEPHTIALLMEHQRRVGADIVFGSYDKIETYHGNRVAEVRRYARLDLLGEDSLAEFAYSRYDALQANVWNCCVDLDVLRQSGLRFIDVNYWEDMAFMFELVTCCRRAVLLPDITYHYMCRYDSLSNYQPRERISREEVMRSVRVADYMKARCCRARGKPYYPLCCHKAAMTSFYIVCYMLRKRRRIVPPFTWAEISGMMRYPATWREVAAFGRRRWPNLLLLALGGLPPALSVPVIWLLGRLKGLL